MEQRQKNQQDLGMQLIIDRIGLLHEDVGELRDDTRASMKEIAGALNKLIIIEERQSHMNEAYARVLTNLEKSDFRHTTLEQRVDALEKEQPMSKLVAKWVIAAVWTAASAAVVLLAKFIGVM